MEARSAAVCVATFLVAVALAGCTEQPAVVEREDPASEEMDAIYVTIRAPRSCNYKGEFDINIQAPDGQTRSGTLGTHYDDCMYNLPGQKWPIRTSGDVQPEDPGVTGPYPYVLFDRVAFNGTWTLNVSLLYFSTWEQDKLGEPHDEVYCAVFYLSLPGRLPLEGGPAPTGQKGYSKATITYDWPTGNATAEGRCNGHPERD